MQNMTCVVVTVLCNQPQSFHFGPWWPCC